MDWHPFGVFIAKVALVSGTIWIAYIVGFVVGYRLNGPHDVDSTYGAVLGVILAWIATSALTIWLAGIPAFVSGVLLYVAIIGTVTSIARRRRRKPMS